jgi:hypothetical protein
MKEGEQGIKEGMEIITGRRYRKLISIQSKPKI